jgi:hypothetical protein
MRIFPKLVTLGDFQNPGCCDFDAQAILCWDRFHAASRSGSL